MATIRLDADQCQLRTIRDFVVRTCHELGVDEQIIPSLELAVDEICTNVIEHGYHGQGGPIEVTVERVENGIQATVRDWGVDFDPQAVPVPDVSAPLEDRPLGGLGLFLVQRLMDAVKFEFGDQDGNTVTMVKRLQRPG